MNLMRCRVLGLSSGNIPGRGYFFRYSSSLADKGTSFYELTSIQFYISVVTVVICASLALLTYLCLMGASICNIRLNGLMKINSFETI